MAFSEVVTARLQSKPGASGRLSSVLTDCDGVLHAVIKSAASANKVRNILFIVIDSCVVATRVGYRPAILTSRRRLRPVPIKGPCFGRFNQVIGFAAGRPRGSLFAGLVPESKSRVLCPPGYRVVGSVVRIPKAPQAVERGGVVKPNPPRESLGETSLPGYQTTNARWKGVLTRRPVRRKKLCEADFSPVSTHATILTARVNPWNGSLVAPRCCIFSRHKPSRLPCQFQLLRHECKYHAFVCAPFYTRQSENPFRSSSLPETICDP